MVLASLEETKFLFPMDALTKERISIQEIKTAMILDTGSEGDVSDVNELTTDFEDLSCEEDNFDEQREGKRQKSTSTDKNPLFSVQDKIEAIQRVLNSDYIDLGELRQLAIDEGGLVNDEIRKIAWPQLMQVGEFEHTSKLLQDDIRCHKDYDQVVLDVKRTLKRFPPGIPEDQRYILMEQLTTLIIRVLDRHPQLHYYQGYHDVAITFLLVVGESMGYELVERLSLTHLHEFMRPTMERTTYYLTYLYPILKRANKKLYEFLIKSNVGTMFCLPWLITWYAHTLSDYRNVVRLYDFFLATPYLMPMYIAVGIVLHREESIFAGECDMAMQHFILSQVPDSLPFEDILKKASRLYSLYPPDDVQEEVQQMVKERILKEEKEIIRAQERKKRLESATKKTNVITNVLASISGKFYLSHRQKKFAQILAFAFTATLATGLYGYYSNSPSLKPYLPWS